MLADHLGISNEWSNAVLARAASTISTYSDVLSTGESIRKAMADLRCEILACTHRLDLTMQHINLLNTAYTNLQCRLSLPLPPLDDTLPSMINAASPIPDDDA